MTLRIDLSGRGRRWAWAVAATVVAVVLLLGLSLWPLGAAAALAAAMLLLPGDEDQGVRTWAAAPSSNGDATVVAETVLRLGPRRAEHSSTMADVPTQRID